MATLRDCVLEVNAAVFNENSIAGTPDQSWLSEVRNKTIPQSLFDFFLQAGCFGFGRAPTYLADSQKILFPFLEGMTVGLRNSLLEAKHCVDSLRPLRARSYTPIKVMKREPFDPNATREIDRNLRDALLTLMGALDQFSEICAILLAPELSGIKPGKASFHEVRKFLEKMSGPSEEVATIRRKHCEILRKQLSGLVNLPDGHAEKHWYELAALLRNKLTHLGTSALHMTVLHDENGEFFTFLPRQWPRFPKQSMSVSPTPDSTTAVSIKDSSEKELMHCDLIEFAEGLRSKVFTVLEVGFSVLCEAYKDLRSTPVNNFAAEALMKNGQSFEFREFLPKNRTT